VTTSSRSHHPSGLSAPKTSLDHQTKEWASGSRGGGKLPADFEWRTNPKQQQEETGDAEGESQAEKSGAEKKSGS
jgi:hypothetical protein